MSAEDEKLKDELRRSARKNCPPGFPVDRMLQWRAADHIARLEQESESWKILAHSCNERAFRLASPPRPEVVRRGVQVLKGISPLKNPPYELPADSFLERIVLDILLVAYLAQSNGP